MREIKFRGIDKKGVWHYGYLWKSPNNIFYIKEFISLSHAADFEVIKESIGQFTGLKNKNEKEIYEGDIISIVNKINNCIIEFKHGSFIRRFLDKRRNNEIKNYIPMNINLWKIIGNIYENPELLKEIK